MIAETAFAIQGDCSANRLLDLAAFFGVGLRRKEGLMLANNVLISVLQNMENVREPSKINGSRDAEPHGNQFLSTREPPGNRDSGGSQGTAINYRANNKLEASANSTTLSLFNSSRSIVDLEKTAETVPASTKNGSRHLAQVVPAWVEPLKVVVRGILPEPLRSLDSDVRFTMARYHCYRFANCTVSEPRNRAAARRVAAGLANLARDHVWGELTVRGYIVAGEKVWRSGGCVPWYRPWDITGMVDVDERS